MDQPRRHRCLFRGLDNRGIAERHWQQERSPGEVERAVPRGETGNHAQRLARDHRDASRHVAVHQVAVGQIAPTRRLAQHGCRKADLERGEHPGRSGFDSHDRHDLLDPPLGDVCRLEEQPLAFTRRQRGPGGERGGRGGDRTFALGAPARRDLGDHAAIVGAAVGKSRSAERCPGAVDEMGGSTDLDGRPDSIEHRSLPRGIACRTGLAASVSGIAVDARAISGKMPLQTG